MGTHQAERANAIQQIAVPNVVLWGRGCFLQDHPEPKLPLEEVFLVKSPASAMQTRASLGRTGHRKDCDQPLGLSLWLVL